MPDNQDIDAVADAVLERLDPGTVIDDKIILNRRQLLAIAGSGLGAGALAALGVDEASAQSGPAGQVGTDAEPVDVYAWDLDVQGSLSGVDAGVQNPLTQTLDADGNDVTNVGAIETDKMAVTESGVIDHGTVSADSGSRVSVTFNSAFSTTPTILHEIGQTATTLPTLATSGVRTAETTGFESQVRNPAGADRDIDHVGWLAVKA